MRFFKPKKGNEAFQFLSILEKYYPKMLTAARKTDVWEEVLLECQAYGLLLDRDSQFLYRTRWPSLTRTVTSKYKNKRSMNKKDKHVISICRLNIPDFCKDYVGEEQPGTNEAADEGLIGDNDNSDAEDCIDRDDGDFDSADAPKNDTVEDENIIKDVVDNMVNIVSDCQDVIESLVEQCADIPPPPIQEAENNKPVLNVRERLTYLNQSTLMSRDASEWGLQLMQRVPYDFTIIVENQEIQISKPFISLESTVFEKMFESKENKVTIPDFKYEIVQAAVNYCYAQKILSILDDENKTIDLLYFCDKYDFKTLKPELEEFLASKVSTSNVSNLVAVAEKSNSPKLRQTCINFIRSLFNHTPNWDNTKLSDFDADFIKDVLTQSLNIKP